jgi:cell division protein ZapA (FtsZ GTPase activity inhibitor)
MAKLEIRLMGQKIQLKASESDPDTVKQVMELVTDQITKVEKRLKSAAPHQVALLALLGLAEEYVRARERTQGYKEEMAAQSERLIELIEAELK